MLSGLGLTEMTFKAEGGLEQGHLRHHTREKAPQAVRRAQQNPEVAVRLRY